MATGNQLRARVPPSHADHIASIATEHNIDETEAERRIIQEGLAALGYEEQPLDGRDLVLWYVRRSGLVFGLVGLILVGYGIFGPRMFSIAGFSLLLVGFAFVAAEEFSDHLTPARE